MLLAYGFAANQTNGIMNSICAVEHLSSKLVIASCKQEPVFLKFMYIYSYSGPENVTDYLTRS